VTSAAQSAKCCDVCGKRPMTEVRHRRALCEGCLGLVHFEERLAALHGLEVVDVVSIHGKITTVHRPPADAELSNQACDDAMRAMATGPNEVDDQLSDSLRVLNTAIAMGDYLSMAAKGINFLRLGAQYLGIVDDLQRPMFINAVASVRRIVRKLDIESAAGPDAAMAGVATLYAAIERLIVGRSITAVSLEANTVGLGRRLMRSLAQVELERLTDDEFCLFVAAVVRARKIVNAPMPPRAGFAKNGNG
jgi:hypothetical protein